MSCAGAVELVQKAVGDYNRRVEINEFDMKNIADRGATFSHDWGWGPDYPARNRNLMMVLCVGAFLISEAIRKRFVALFLSLACYAITFPLIYQWITAAVRDLSSQPLYLSDPPYLLQITSEFDWLWP